MRLPALISGLVLAQSGGRVSSVDAEHRTSRTGSVRFRRGRRALVGA